MKTIPMTVLIAASMLWTNAQAATFTVTTTAPSGPGSLQQAIVDANTAGGANTITFSIGPDDDQVKTIYINAAMTPLTSATTIDGFTQSGASSNTLAIGNNAVLLIEVTTTNGAQGLSSQFAGGTIRGLVINGFNQGITLGINGAGSVVEGCFIGTDTTGTNASARVNGTGILCQSGSSRIGGTNPWQRNIISGTTGYGIDTINGLATNNLIIGNYIGTDKTGTQAIPNSYGIVAEAPHTQIKSNVVSGNQASGVFLASASNVVEGCYVGTTATGLAALPNGNKGVEVSNFPGNRVGGTNAAARNIVSGNIGFGVTASAADNTLIAGNFIGVNITGTNALPNSLNGVHMDLSTGNTVTNNVIAGNTGGGITMTRGGSHEILDNHIGTDATDALDLGNGSIGIDANSSSHFNTFAGNVIAYNSAGISMNNGSDSNNVTSNLIYSNTVYGVFVTLSAVADHISQNSIYDNGSLGIITSPGGVPTVNDPCDTDTGNNNLQNYPVLTAATSTVSSVTIAGFLPSAPSTTFTLEFFANTVCDPTGFGEGEFFIGATNVTTGANCTNIFNVTFPVAVADALLITATATDPDGNTSDFSKCFTNVSTAVTIDCSLTPQIDTNTVGQTHIVTATITTNGTPIAGLAVSFSVSGAHTIAATNVTTAGNGQAQFSYLGTNVGTDTILAAGGIGGSEFSCDATKVWISAVSNQPPVAVCQDVTTNANGSCQASVTAGSVDNGSSDPDGVSVTLSLSPAGPYALGTNAVTLIAVDANSATDTCQAAIIVLDQTAPSITCPSDITTNVVAGQTNAVVNYPAPTVSDNCSVASSNSVPASGSSFALGTNTVTSTATDGSGNTNSCTFKIIVNVAASNQPPVAACRNVTTNANGSCQASVPATAVDNGSTDDGSITNRTLTPAGPYGLGTNNVTLTVFDDDGASNTCAAVIIVVDSTAPSITCPSDITTNVVAGQTNAVVNYPAPTVSDNCSLASTNSVPASGTSFALGTNTVTSTVVDGSGNTNSCTFRIIVNETPVGPCPDLTGTWTNVVQTCKVKNEVPSCKVKGTLLVDNIGTEDAGSSFVRYYLSDDATFDGGADTLLKQVNTGSVKLEKIKKRTLSAKLPVGIDGTGKYIIAVIDADEQIAECNEANNIVVFGPLP